MKNNRPKRSKTSVTFAVNPNKKEEFAVALGEASMVANGVLGYSGIVSMMMEMGVDRELLNQMKNGWGRGSWRLRKKRLTKALKQSFINRMFEAGLQRIENGVVV